MSLKISDIPGSIKNWKKFKISGVKWFFFHRNFVHNFAVKCS